MKKHKKYENTDILACLGAAVQANTEHYKSDFDYDVKELTEAGSGQELARFLWMSRRCGTELFPEREVYLAPSCANTSFLHRLTDANERPAVFAVCVKGMRDGKVFGDVCGIEPSWLLDHVRKNTLEVVRVIARYEDGTELDLPYAEWDGHRDRLCMRFGNLLSLVRNPEDEGVLCAILDDAREKREKEALASVLEHGPALSAARTAGEKHTDEEGESR
jgi:hypothetical protein